jgi:cation:H+ antiporter
MDFGTHSLSVNLAIFGGAAVLVWVAGTRLARYADAISARTKLSKAFLGLVLLAVATSLPEIATTVAGARLGNAQLVAGNLFGGVALQVAILALVDAIAVRGALTYFTPQPMLLMQGVMLLLLLSVAVAGVAAGDPIAFAGLGLTPILLVAGYVLTLWWSKSGVGQPRWRATDDPLAGREEPAVAEPLAHLSNPRLYIYSVVGAVAILVAGWALARTGDALAEQTGLGASFVGVVLVAASTSLPELSTTLAAVRLGNHQMAVSNILGTNCLELALFFVGDVLYRDGPLLAAADRSALFAAALGMVVTSIYLLGMLERRNRTVLRMGYDSAGVLATYAAGIVGLYFLR